MLVGPVPHGTLQVCEEGPDQLVTVLDVALQ